MRSMRVRCVGMRNMGMVPVRSMTMEEHLAGRIDTILYIEDAGVGLKNHRSFSSIVGMRFVTMGGGIRVPRGHHRRRQVQCARAVVDGRGRVVVGRRWQHASRHREGAAA